MAECTPEELKSTSKALYGELDYDVSNPHNAFKSTLNSIKANSLPIPEKFKKDYAGLLHPKTNVISRFTARPEYIVPEKIFTDIKKAYDLSFKIGGQDRAIKETNNLARKLSKNIDSFDFLNGQQYNYTKKWLDNMGSAKDQSSNWLKDRLNSAYGNMFRTNIHVSALNMLELNRIFTSEPLHTFKGIADSLEATSGKFWEVPEEIKKSGVYNKNYDEKVTLSNFSVIEPTQNFLESVAYYTAKSANAGVVDAKNANKLSYTYEYFNKPEMVFDESAKINTSLMRYAVEDMKYIYGNAAQMIIAPTGNEKLKAAQTLFTTLGLRSVLFGAGSVVPKPILNALLDEEQQQELNSSPFMNVLDKITGIDISNSMQVGNIVIGVAQGIITNNVKYGYKNLVDANTAFKEGDEEAAQISLLKAVKNLSIFAPYVGDSVFRKGVDTYLDSKETESNDFNFPAEYLKKLSGFKSTSKTEEIN